MAHFPFSAIVGSHQLTRALLLGAVDPRIGGVLVRGQKGSAKSTAVRALAALLPDIEVVPGCAFACPPGVPAAACTVCEPDSPHVNVRTPLVELPVGAGEDRLVGSIDLEAALSEGKRHFQPGLLASAHRGLLYVDEVNLLDDHLVNVLLDAAAMGVNHVEREGVSIEHPARFQLIGTMNPEEGELRPQLLDRFGLTVEVASPTDAGLRSTVVRRRLAFEADPEGFAAEYADEEKALAEQVMAARSLIEAAVLSEHWLTRIVTVCAAFEVEGMRADIVTARTAVALAAWNGRDSVERADVREACLLTLPHRRRRGPFDDPGIDEDELDRLLDEDPPPPPEGGEGDDPRPDGSDPTGSSAPGDGSGESDRPDGVPQSPAPSADPAESTADQSSSEPRATAPDRVEAPGRPPARPALLTAPNRRFGVSGRRSSGPSARGAAVRSRAVRMGQHVNTADLALAATVRAWAARGGAGTIQREDLQVFERRGRQGHLIVLCVDASGSMGARRRMAAVKGAVRSLLFDAYQRRDLVSLVTFRGRGAQVVLEPTAGVELADRRLAVLPTGGRTPLADGLVRASEVIGRHALRDPDRRPLLVLVTDGRANNGPAVEKAAAHVAGQEIASVVIDTESGFVRTGKAAEIARSLGAPSVRLEDFAADGLVRTIQLMSGR